MTRRGRFKPIHPLTDSTASEGRLIGYRRLKEQPPAALVPVFADPRRRSTVFLYQQSDIADRIERFVGDPDLRAYHTIPQRTNDVEIIARVGDRALHAYELQDGRIIAERGEQFRRLLQLTLDKQEFSGKPFAGLDVARFLTDGNSEIGFAAACAKSLVARSTALAQTWLRGARLSPAARRAAKAAIREATEDDSSAVDDQNTEIEEPDIEQDQDAFPQFMVDRYRETHQGHPDGTAELKRFLHQIGSAPRQEERIALLLKELLSRPNDAKRIVRTYGADRAKFATDALELIHSAVAKSWSTNTANNSILVSKIIDTLYTRAFPQGRGPLIFFLAKHLGSQPALNRFLRAKLRIIQSTYVQRHNREITALLDQSRSSMT